MQFPFGTAMPRPIPGLGALAASSPGSALSTPAYGFPNVEQPTPPEAADPLDGFDFNFDLVQRIAQNSGFDPAASPAESWRESNIKRRGMLEALWDQQMRDGFRRDATEFSFLKPSGEPALGVPTKPDDAPLFDELRRTSGLSVDFAPELGGFIGTLRGRDGVTPIADLPRAWLRDIAADPERYQNRLWAIDEIQRGAPSAAFGAAQDRLGRTGAPGGAGRNLDARTVEALRYLFPDLTDIPVSEERRRSVGLKTPFESIIGSLFRSPVPLNADGFGMTLSEFLDPGALGRFLRDVLPISGSFQSAKYGQESMHKAVGALFEGDLMGFATNGGLALADAIGTIPGLSAPANAVKRRVLAGLDTIEPWRKFDGHRALAKGRRQEKQFRAELMQKKARAAKRDAEKRLTPGEKQARQSESPLKKLHDKGPPSAFESASPFRVFGDILPDMSPKQQSLVLGLFGPILGRTIERRMVRQGERAGYDVTAQGKGGPTAITVEVDGSAYRRIYDAVIQRSSGSIRNSFLKLFDGKSTNKIALDFKGNRNKNKVQDLIDENFPKDTDFADHAARFTTKDIPPEEFQAVAREMFTKHAGYGEKKLSPRQIDDLVDRFDRLRRQGGDWLTPEILSGLVARSIAHLLANRPPPSNPANADQ